MLSATTLVKVARTLHQWYADGALCTHVLPCMLLFNVLVLCVLFVLRQLVAAGIAHWRRQRRPLKGPDFIYNLEDCPICFQAFRDPVRLHCGHVNCLECISKYCRLMSDYQNFKCSLCREPIRGILYLDGYAPSRLNKRRKQLKLAELRQMMSIQRKELDWYTSSCGSAYVLVVMTIAFISCCIYYSFY